MFNKSTTGDSIRFRCQVAPDQPVLGSNVGTLLKFNGLRLSTVRRSRLEAGMMAVVSILVFAGAFALSAGIIAAAIGPQWRRIVSLASGRVEQSFAPLEQLASAERRIAVRRWASAPVPAPITRLREVA